MMRGLCETPAPLRGKFLLYQSFSLAIGGLIGRDTRDHSLPVDLLRLCQIVPPVILHVPIEPARPVLRGFRRRQDLRRETIGRELAGVGARHLTGESFGGVHAGVRKCWARPKRLRAVGLETSQHSSTQRTLQPLATRSTAIAVRRSCCSAERWCQRGAARVSVR